MHVSLVKCNHRKLHRSSYEEQKAYKVGNMACSIQADLIIQTTDLTSYQPIFTSGEWYRSDCCLKHPVMRAQRIHKYKPIHDCILYWIKRETTGLRHFLTCASFSSSSNTALKPPIEWLFTLSAASFILELGIPASLSLLGLNSILSISSGIASSSWSWASKVVCKRVALWTACMGKDTRYDI